MREFWINKNRWPNDPKGYVFLARALHEIGQARFGNDWAGTEWAVNVPPVLTGDLPHQPDKRLLARILLEAHRPDIELGEIITGSKHTVSGAPLTAEQWAIARDLSNQQFQKVRPFLVRSAAVQAAFIKASEAQELITAYRPTAGGEMRPIPAPWWNTETNHNRFVMCQLNPHKPFGLGFAGDNYAWIFVTRDSLDRFITSQPFAKPAGIEGHLSPYLRVMLAVSKELDINSGNQPKKEVVVAALKAAWTRPAPLSNKLIETMATLLREPESQLGRARRDENKR
jgi:hypothetical protein